MNKKFLSAVFVVACFGIISGFIYELLITNVNASGNCSNSMSTNLNNSNSQEYMLSEECVLYIKLNDHQAYANHITFEAHDSHANYLMDIYFASQDGRYQIAHHGIDVSTQDNCDSYGNSNCFKHYEFPIGQHANSLAIRVYNDPHKSRGHNDYAYFRNIQIEGNGQQAHSYNQNYQHYQAPNHNNNYGNNGGQNTSNCNMNFSDTKGNRYDQVIRQAACQGITQGYSNNTFQPQAPITREEFMTMLSRTFPDAFNSQNGNCSSFNDMNQNSTHAQNVNRARCANVVNGYSDNTFRPNNYVTYGEAASILYNLTMRYGYNPSHISINYQPNFVSNSSPHFNSIYYLSNINSQYYPAYDYNEIGATQDGNYANRGWVANSMMGVRDYLY